MQSHENVIIYRCETTPGVTLIGIACIIFRSPRLLSLKKALAANNHHPLAWTARKKVAHHSAGFAEKKGVCAANLRVSLTTESLCTSQNQIPPRPERNEPSDSQHFGVLVDLPTRKCKRVDKETHRKADAGQYGNAIQMTPSAAFRQ